MKVFKFKKDRKAKLIFILVGIASTVWFLIRVIPKPQRATYPCMRAAAPFASSFVIYLTGIFASVFSIRKFRNYSANNRYVLASVFLVVAAITGFLTTQVNPTPAWSGVAGITNIEANEPMGVAKGIFPGRVAWIYDADATNEDCTNDFGDGYFMDENTDQDVVDNMLNKAIKVISGKGILSEGWDAIFKYHNKEVGKGEVGYSNGEIIFIKINTTSAWDGNHEMNLDRVNNNNYAIGETSPHVVTSVLRHLINIAGVPQRNIYIGDPMKHIYADNFEKWHDEFPNVHYLDNEYTTGGREVAAKSNTANIQYSDRGKVLREGSWNSALEGDSVFSDKLYSILEECDYLINLPSLKGHIRAGVTMFAKNHFGSHTRPEALHLHGGLVKMGNDPTRDQYGSYRVLVDFMGHELTGKKNLIYIMDALYSSDHEIQVPVKWDKAPWNNDWSSSLFISQDPVAIESVGFDMLYHIYDGTNGLNSYPHMGAVDDYLEQAADSSNWPEGIVYDPENDGTPIGSLGVHEHWNNNTDMEYSRNLGTGDGIEFLKIFPDTDVNAIIGFTDIKTSAISLQVYPTPSKGVVYLDYTSEGSDEIDITITDMSGVVVYTENLVSEDLSGYRIDCGDLSNGSYVLTVNQGNSSKTGTIIIKK